MACRKAAEEMVPALMGRDKNSQHGTPGFKVVSFTPFNPDVKHTASTVDDLTTGKTFKCIKGAPHVIINMCGGHDEAHHAVIDFAHRGLRALGVAITTDAAMEKFELVGMISLLDPPRPDSGKTIKECQQLGIMVKMITGDQTIIGKEVAHRLGMNRCILDSRLLVDPKCSEKQLTDRVVKADGFAQVIPEHKYLFVCNFF